MPTRRVSRREFLGSSLGAAAATVLAGCAGTGPHQTARAPARGAKDAGSEDKMVTLTVGEGKYQGRSNAAIQQAVDDAAAAGGGTVIVSPGTYLMHDALHLRSGVRVAGRAGAVLRKVPSIQSRIPAFLGYGHYEIIVDEPDKFPVGTGVHILDDGAGGFYTTVATVVGRRGDLLFINRMLNHDYHVKKNARVISVYPIVEAEGIEDAAVEGLTIDGNSGEETFALNGCRGGGIFLIRSARLAIRNCEVANFRGDGVSFQQCTDILVERCHVHHQTGSGLHPGSGTVRYVMQDNRIHDNGNCGIFYCLRTTHSICRRNEVRASARAGISIGERDTDHLVADNHIADNGAEGILFRPFDHIGADRVVVTGNRIGPNGANEPRTEVAVAPGLSDVHVIDNTFTPGRGPLIMVGQGCRNVSFAGNKVGGREAGVGDVADLPPGVLRERPPSLPPVGPAALAPDGARHLNIAKLPPWDEPRMWR